MASDRARNSYDPSRAYRSVVAQQGRVTLEADVNEAALIEGEALRLETIDIVGPAGTPDDGYKVSAPGNINEVTIGAGIYYLGGWRLELGTAVALNKQPDWLDAPPLPESGNGLVALLLTEQSVCAVEDQALRDVALGGPDTAARLRLMQQFPLIDTGGDTCASAAAILAMDLAAEGIAIDPYSRQLLSDARLQVGFVPDGVPPDPCTPAAAGGYLGADNQLIRVTVSAYDPQAKTGSLLWGWNNASILYRTASDATGTLLSLLGAPVDQEHAPQQFQAVEILRSRAELKDGAFTPAEMKDRNFVAAESGFVTTVATGYDFDSGTLILTDALLPDYIADANPLFIRLWQAIVPFNAGQATALDAVSGVTVTISLTALPTQPVARPFWRFAVRPDTPVEIYPVRYLEAPQPPDGPRQWLGDLAVVGFVGDSFGALADCRPTFVSLTEQIDCCCGLTLDPKGVDARGGLQAVVDSLAGNPAVLTLKPGEYVLRAPLILTGHHRRLIIEGCSFGASISAHPNSLTEFGFGLIVIEKTDAITLRGLEFDVAMVPNAAGGGTVAGVLVGDSGLIVIEDCTFGIAFPNDGRIGKTRVEAATGAAVDGTAVVFGGAIAVVGRAAELTVRRNRFVGKNIVDGGVVCGLIASVNTQNIHTSLVGVDISDNYFERLNAGVFAYAHLGEVRCADNRVKNCNTGLFFAETRLGATGAFAKQAIGRVADHPDLAKAVQSDLQFHWLALSAQNQAPFFTRMSPPTGAAPSTVAHDVLLKDMTTRGEAAYTAVTAARATGETRVLSAKTALGQTQSVPEAAAADAPATEAAKAQAAQDHLQFAAELQHVQAVAVAAQLANITLTAAVHIHNNDIALAKTNIAAVQKNSVAPPGIGIAVIMSPRDDVGMVLLTANRVICPDSRTSAATLFFPTEAAVTGNVMIHPTVAQGTFNHSVFTAVGLQGGSYAYAGNVFRSGAFITPPRAATGATTDWDFLNTVT